MSMIEGEYSVVAVRDDGDEERKENARAALTAFVGKHEKEATDRVGRRRQLENRWLSDLRQYHGVYEDKVLTQLQEQDGSELFLNVTRHKTNTAAAKMYDMLFPTDDRNWGIEPTPVPEIERAIKDADKKGDAVANRANELVQQGKVEEAQQLVTEARPILSKGAQAREVRSEAWERSEGMTDAIEDQLNECSYNTESRLVIEDAVQIGTGVMKGPVKSMRPTRKWVTEQLQDGTSHTRLELNQSHMRAAFYRVDPWHFFPDPDATDIDIPQDIYERHIFKDRDLRRLAKQKGFSQDGIRRLLREGPRDNVPYFMSDMRTITGAHTDTGADVFHVWEAYVTITAEEIMQIASSMGREEMASDYADFDELEEFHICAWFCQGELIKFGEHPLDTNDGLYSVFCWQKDQSSINGYGVPYTMRDQQSAICAGWRMVMDQGGLSAVPQVVIDKYSVEPEDGSGDYSLRSGKVWLTTRPIPNGTKVFQVEHIDAKISELLVIINTAMQFIDDETGISQLAQGEQGANLTKTAQGMAILMNSTNVVFRRVIRAYDDDMTKPNIRRIYDWTMQWWGDETVKGDFEVNARGSSVLMVREIQSQNMMALASLALSDPELRGATKILEAYRALVRAMNIPEEQWVKSDEEFAEWVAQQQEQQAQRPDPEMMKLQLQQQIAEMESQNRLQIAQIQHETKMMEVVQNSNVKIDQIEAMLEKVRMETNAKERGMAAEIAVAERTRQHAGGAI